MIQIAPTKGWVVTHSLPQNFINTAITVTANSPFADAIRAEFHRRKPKKIIETGTFEATGTTWIIHMAMYEAGITDADFITMECNHINYGKALGNINQRQMRVRAFLALSVPRWMLPTKRQIQTDCVETVRDGVFIDFYDQDRAEQYWNETANPMIPDDFLGMSMAWFGGRPDFVLMDSSGHLGKIEFDYLMTLMKGPCTIALDDTLHFKNIDSLAAAKADPRFSVIAEGPDKFGWALVRFDPVPVGFDEHAATGGKLTEHASGAAMGLIAEGAELANI